MDEISEFIPEEPTYEDPHELLDEVQEFYFPHLS